MGYSRKVAIVKNFEKVVKKPVPPVPNLYQPKK